RSSFSNFGSCLDLFAPGVAIWSANIAAPNYYVTMDGTSMAAPAVTGMAARFLEAIPSATPASVQNWVVSNATTNVVINPGLNSPNRLAYIAPAN
ncbi:MAG TPA: S8 family serine peptidase, partial [Archangium sp.]|nr:S8 family serine peptidase [Archangium sp.]